MAAPYGSRSRKPRSSRGLGKHEFAKYHALGNDYLVVDQARLGLALSRSRVRALCDRHTGIGSDGILARVASRRADFGMRIFNPDGSEAEKSGNGLRIFARFLRDCGYTRARAFTVETKGGIVESELVLRGGKVAQVRVAMGRASFDSRAIPMTGPPREVVHERLSVGSRLLRVTGVSVGNPHCVVFRRELDPEELLRDGPLIERHPVFPKRVNVQLARVRSRRVVEALIWERGAGATLASGSSSCAIAAAAYRSGLIDRRVTIEMPGGKLQIEIDDDFALHMTGPATPVFRGHLLSHP